MILAFFKAPLNIKLTYLFDVICTAVFAYLLFDGLMVIWFNGPFSRISLLGFLIPHSSKVVLWSAAALLWLRPRWKWRFPFAMFGLYCASELLTNMVWMLVHLPFGYIFPPGTKPLFILSESFFILGITLCYLFMKGRFELKKDWAMLPFGIFVSSWVLLGYNTEATITVASYWLEAQEFIWNVLYITMIYSVFRPKRPELP